MFNLACSQALYFSLDIFEDAYRNKNREGFIEGGLGWGKRENSSFFSRIPIRFRARTKREHCRIVEKKNFCGQAMFNHSYLQSIFEKVSKIEMVMSVNTNGIAFPLKPTAPSHHPPSFRLPKYIVVHNYGSITLSCK